MTKDANWFGAVASNVKIEDLKKDKKVSKKQDEVKKQDGNR